VQDNPAARSIARVALIVFGVIASAVTVIAVVESYSNLLAFARAYGLAGWRAALAPAAADAFIILGELLLFAAILLRWGTLPHVLGFGMAIWGFLLSVGGNIWHAPLATIADRAVSAIWPVTATAGLAGGLIIVRQVMNASGAPAHPPGGGTGIQLPPPVPSREEEPRRAGAASSPGSARARRGRGRAAAPEQEQALVAELLAAGGPLPSVMSLSRERYGMDRSRMVERALETAKAQMNGSGRGSG
jgi:hypothetical protein